MEKSFKNYQVIETEGMSAEALQLILNKATDSFPEKQIEHVIGTKIILSYESLFTEKGRKENALKASSYESIRVPAGALAPMEFKNDYLGTWVKGEKDPGRGVKNCRKN